MTFLRFAAAAAMLFATQAMAQTPGADPAQVAPAPEATNPVAPPADQAMVRVPAGTVIAVELAEPLSSRTSQTGQTFALRLAEPIIINDEIAVPAGAVGGGEVIDAHRSGMGGREGKLIVSGRYIEVNGQRVRIRGMQILMAGEDLSRDAVTVSLIPYVGIIGGFVQGGEVELPVGTRAQARLAVDIEVAPSVVAANAAAVEPVMAEGEEQ